jgi:hypothetical protein
VKEHLSRKRLLWRARVKIDRRAAVHRRALRIGKLDSLQPRFLISGALVFFSVNRKARHT